MLLRVVATAQWKHVSPSLGEPDCVEAALNLRHRKTRIWWKVPNIQLIDKDSHTASVTISGEVDIRTAAMGAPLEDGTWDVGMRTSLFGFVHHRALPSPHTKSPFVAVIGGRVAIVYATKSGALALDIGENTRKLIRDVTFDPEQIGISENGDLIIPFSDVSVEGSAKLDCILRLSPKWLAPIRRKTVRASIVFGDGRGYIAASLAGLTGTFALAVERGTLRQIPIRVRLSRTNVPVLLDVFGEVTGNVSPSQG